MSRTIVAEVACLLAAAVPQPASAAAGAISGTCVADYQSIPDTTDMLLVVTAEAHATGPDVATTTSVRCTVRTFYGETVTARTSMLGADVYTASAGKVRLSSHLTFCMAAEAMFVTASFDTVVVTSSDCGGLSPL